MQSSDFERFREIMVGMGKVYERDVDAVLLDAYWGALHDWSMDDFQSTAKELIATSVHMPRPADFNAMRKKVNAVSGVEAWNFARRHAVSRAGQPPGVTCAELGAHPAIEQVVASLGGLYVLWACPADKLHFLERQFHDRYAEISDVLETREAVPDLADPRPAKQIEGPA